MPSELSSKKALVIDDFPEMRYSLKRMLESFGVKEPQDASTGERALELMAATAFDVVLCDYNLGPDRKDGQQILEEAKHRGLLRHSAIFMMITAENTMEMVMGAVEYRPDDYLTKPFTRDVLETRLQRLIERKAVLEDIAAAAHRKDYAKAIALCDARIAEKPRNLLDIYKLKAELCVECGRLTDAASVYDTVLVMRALPWARAGRGKVHFLSREFGKAREVFEALLAENKFYIEAYDWLAKCRIEQGDSKGAQEVLKTAIDLSPKAINRHKDLGEIALRNEDYSTAESSFRSAISMGKHSFLKDPSHYTGLAKVLVKTDAADAALEITASARREFADRPDAAIQASMVEGVAYKKLNREDDAKKALGEAARLMDDLGDKVSTDLAMEMAQTCFEVGDREKATELVQKVVRNHHEDEAVLRKAQAVFEAVGAQEEGKEIIESARREIAEINNQGVHLVREGRLDEAIELFERAANGLPENCTVNLNAAQAYLLYVKRNGVAADYLDRSRRCLERAARVAPNGAKLQKLLGVYRELSAA